MTETSRRIYRSAWQSSNEIREVLQGIFVAELLRPSRCVWIVSPWISDVAVIDNRMAAFDVLNPSWGAREWHLSEVLCQLLHVGTVIRMATRPGAPNRPVLPQLSAAVEEYGLPESSFKVFETDQLHEKGLLGDDYYLSGSMNLTFSGVELLEEMVTLDVSAEGVAEARLVYFSRWGGCLPRQPGDRP